MSYNFAFGDEVDKTIEESKQDFTKVIFPFKSGTTVKVRVPASRPRASVKMHGAYKVFNSSPCTGADDLYCKAAEWYRNEANKAREAGDEELNKEMYTKYNQLRGKPRVFVGFINLSTGEPIVIDLSTKQYEAIRKPLDKYSKKINDYPFELSKTGSGKDTAITLSIILDDDELKANEIENFTKSADTDIDKEVFANCLIVHDDETQIKNLTAFGFDIKNLEGDEEDYQF